MDLLAFCTAICTSDDAPSAPAKAGVYVIVNTKTNRFYIGQSRNVAKRLKQHRKHLDSGTHSNKPLMSDWLAFGPASFRMQAVMCVPANECQEIESRLIAEHVGPSCYNIPWDEVEWNGGRPPISPSGELMKSRPVRMTDAEWEKCKRLGGAAWLRNEIDLA